MAQINVRISDEDRDILMEMAKEEDRTISYIVRKAIAHYIEQHQTVEKE
jgi:predicted DNA-binding protein